MKNSKETKKVKGVKSQDNINNDIQRKLLNRVRTKIIVLLINMLSFAIILFFTDFKSINNEWMFVGFSSFVSFLILIFILFDLCKYAANNAKNTCYNYYSFPKKEKVEVIIKKNIIYDNIIVKIIPELVYKKSRRSPDIGTTCSKCGRNVNISFYDIRVAINLGFFKQNKSFKFGRQNHKPAATDNFYYKISNELMNSHFTVISKCPHCKEDAEFISPCPINELYHKEYLNRFKRR